MFELSDERLAKARVYADSLGLPHLAMPPTEPMAALEAIALAAMDEGTPECLCGVCAAVKRLVPDWVCDEDREEAYRKLCRALSRLCA